MHGSHFTPEQLARLKARHAAVGGGAFDRWRRQWAELDDELSRHAAQGTDPADPVVQELARRWTSLMDEMTGADRHVLSSMYAKLDGEGAEAATLGAVGEGTWSYVKRAFAVGFGLAP